MTRRGPKSPEHRAKLAAHLARVKHDPTGERRGTQTRQKISNTRAPRPFSDRFWGKVGRSAGPEACWPWLGVRSPWGYGTVLIGSRLTNDRRRVMAHRVAYELTRGPIPHGLKALHLCDNPPCCNPAHLRIGTQVDNIRDMEAKGRARRIGHEHPPRFSGPDHPKAKLTEHQADQIRLRYAAGSITQTALAREYGVNQTTISGIIRGRHWTARHQDRR